MPSVWKKYLAPIFLVANDRFEPMENIMPTRVAGAFESGSEPMAETKTMMMMKMISVLIFILPMKNKIKKVKRGSHILIM